MNSSKTSRSKNKAKEEEEEKNTTFDWVAYSRTACRYLDTLSCTLAAMVGSLL
jgi:hypothetical protein